MRSDDVLRRLEAWHEGRPLPRYSTIHHHIADPVDVLVLAFVRMGGESAPWGIAVGHPGETPKFLAVPEARNRDLVAGMAAELSPVLLEHFRHPDYSGDAIDGPGDALPLRQLWVPNATHVDMLHHLAYGYTFTKWPAAERVKKLNALGRLAGWLFREAQRPGQMTVLQATEVLARSYAFPADPIRQAHLGFLLAWLETRGARDERLAAAMLAECESISTSLDPLLERHELEMHVDRWFQAQRAQDESTMRRQDATIRRILRSELERRLELTSRAIRLVADDPRPYNNGVTLLARESGKEHWYQYLRMELRRRDDDDGPAFVPSPETDRYPAAAASRYFVHAASEDFRVGALIHGDEELQNELIAAGDAVRGTIISVRDDGDGRATQPVWVLGVHGEIPVRIREGSELCVAGLPNRKVQVDGIDPKPDGTLRIEVAVTSLKTVPHARSDVPPAASPQLRGTEVTLLPTNRDGISRLKSRRVWQRAVPGAWLTHAAPAGPHAELPDDVAESLVSGDGE